MRISIVKSVALALGLATSAVSQTTDTMNINMNIAAEMTGPMMSSTLAPMKCMASYLVTPGDTCMKIIQMHPNTLNLEQLLLWNPMIRRDCRNLQPNEAICIRALVRADCPSTMTTTTPTPSMTMSTY